MTLKDDYKRLTGESGWRWAVRELGWGGFYLLTLLWSWGAVARVMQWFKE